MANDAKSCLFLANINSESNIEGGTFRLSDLKCNSESNNPSDDINSHSNNLVTYSKDNSTHLY